MFVNGYAALYANSILTNSVGIDGGGVYLINSNATLVGNTIVANTSGVYGGGLSLRGSPATLIGNTIMFNTTSFYPARYPDGGGSVDLGSGSNATFINNIIANNDGGPFGQIHVNQSTPAFIHTTIVDNVNPTALGLSIDTPPSTLAMTNTILVGHAVGISVSAGTSAMLTGTLWYSNTQDWAGGGSVISATNYRASPVFVAPEAGDFHISSTSAAIDHGVRTPVFFDIDGEPRVNTPDLGADEYWAPGTLKQIYLPLIRK